MHVHTHWLLRSWGPFSSIISHIEEFLSHTLPLPCTYLIRCQEWTLSQLNHKWVFHSNALGRWISETFSIEAAFVACVAYFAIATSHNWKLCGVWRLITCIPSVTVSEQVRKCTLTEPKNCGRGYKSFSFDFCISFLKTNGKNHSVAQAWMWSKEETNNLVL